jgi:aminoglycoside phosphotransferase (APT) family kinase protein
MATLSLPTIRDPRYGRIVIVKGCFVVKYGMLMTENEGHALLLLEKYIIIPAPRLYAMYREGETLYLVMGLMLGRQLGLIWDDLSEEEKLPILKHLRSILDYMRSLPPPAIISSVSGGPLRHRFFLWPEPEPKITGPFEKEEDLDYALALRSRKNWESYQKRPWTSEFFARNLPVALKGHGTVFTHGDLQRKNILVEQLLLETRDVERQFRVSAILDWEDAGWYPSY